MPGKLQVFVLQRQDVIVMKLFAGRPRDVADVQSLHPTPNESTFAKRQLPRLQAIDATRCASMESFLRQASREFP